MAIDTIGFEEIADTIRDFSEPLTVLRPTTQTTRYGFTTLVDVSVANVTGHMQPLSDKELRYVPEGINTLEWWNIWSLDELKNGDKVTDGSAPIVTVSKLKAWKEGTFWHVQGVVVDDDTVLPLPQAFASAFAPAFR